MSDPLVQRYRAARRDRELALLEGFHALKHALRFGAEVIEAVSSDPGELERLAAGLAPDLAGTLAARTTQVDTELVAQVVPHAPHTGVVAIARRPGVDVAAVLGGDRAAPVVLLEEPRTMGNMGACVRVAAAADAAAVLTTGSNDPWHPEALRGAAGLHFALPVAQVEELPRGDRPLVAIDPEGEPLGEGELDPALGSRLRHRALRAQRGAARARRRPPGDPDAGGRLQPQPGDRGCGRALYAATLNRRLVGWQQSPTTSRKDSLCPLPTSTSEKPSS